MLAAVQWFKSISTVIPVCFLASQWLRYPRIGLKLCVAKNTCEARFVPCVFGLTLFGHVGEALQVTTAYVNFQYCDHPQ